MDSADEPEKPEVKDQYCVAETDDPPLSAKAVLDFISTSKREWSKPREDGSYARLSIYADQYRSVIRALELGMDAMGGDG